MAERLSEPQNWVKDVEMRVSREGFNFAQKRPHRFWVLSFRNIAIDCRVRLDRHKAEQNTYWCRPPVDRGFRYRYARGRFDDYLERKRVYYKNHPVLSRLVTLIGAGFLYIRGVQLFLFRVHTAEWNIGDIEHALCL